MNALKTIYRKSSLLWPRYFVQNTPGFVAYHVSHRINSVWEKDYVSPHPDREFYYNNPPAEGDAMHTVNIKSAPTRHFYSIFHDPTVEKFEKMILKKGRGDLAYGIMNETLRQIKLVQLSKYHQATEEEKTEIETNPLVIFHQAIRNATPAMALRTQVKGGASFQIPIPISDKKKFFMTSSWMLSHCRSGKPNTPMSERLAKEIIAAYNNEGAAVKRKQDLHRQVVANRAYIHLNWES